MFDALQLHGQNGHVAWMKVRDVQSDLAVRCFSDLDRDDIKALVTVD